MASSWVLARAALGALLWPIYYLNTSDAVTATVASVIQWGYSGVLALLLTRQSSSRRSILAMASFAVFDLGHVGVSLLGIPQAATAGPLPDLSGVVLTAEDLPGFDEMPPGHQSLQTGPQLDGEHRAESAFMWVHKEPLEVVGGLTVLFPTGCPHHCRAR